jgi:hypothetical protein
VCVRQAGEKIGYLGIVRCDDQNIFGLESAAVACAAKPSDGRIEQALDNFRDHVDFFG